MMALWFTLKTANGTKSKLKFQSCLNDGIHSQKYDMYISSAADGIHAMEVSYVCAFQSITSIDFSSAADSILAIGVSCYLMLMLY